MFCHSDAASTSLPCSIPLKSSLMSNPPKPWSFSFAFSKSKKKNKAEKDKTSVTVALGRGLSASASNYHTNDHPSIFDNKYIGVTPVPGSREFFQAVNQGAKSGFPSTSGSTTLIEEDKKTLANGLSSSEEIIPEDFDEGELPRIIEDLCGGSMAQRKKALKKIRTMTKTSDKIREMIVNAGCVPALLELSASRDEEMANNAVATLLNVSIANSNKSRMVSLGAIEPLAAAMRSPVECIRESAIAAIFSLSVLDDNKVAIGTSDALALLVGIIRAGTEPEKQDASKALCNLSMVTTNKWRLVGAGAVGALIRALEESSPSLAERYVFVLANLTTIPEGRQAIAECADGISELAEALDWGTPRAKECAVVALLQLARHEPPVRQVIARELIVPRLLRLSQTGESRAKTKAQALLELLRQNE